MNQTNEAVQRSFAEDWFPSVAYMLRVAGDLAVAEECVQSAFEAALKAWPKAMPGNSGAWIRKVARNRFIDQARAASSRKGALEILARAEEAYTEPGASSGVDDELALIFLCSHPAISPTDQVILILRLVGGLTPKEIAAAFYAGEDAIRSRLLRAKRKMRAANIPTVMLEKKELSKRFGQVLAAIYLIYNEGYLTSSEVHEERRDLVHDAIRLAANLCLLAPNLAEAHGLMALILLSEARRPARFIQGELISLEEQDQDLWDIDLIQAGLMHLGRVGDEPAGIYTIQAKIAALHSTRGSFTATDWPAITALYDRLLVVEISPATKLNRLAAVSFIQPLAQSLAELEILEQEGLIGAQTQALRADFYRRDGQMKEAACAYKAAIELERKASVRAFLERRLAVI